MSESSNTLADRLDTAQTKLTKLQRKLNRGTIITAVVAALLLALMAGYFYFGYREISELLEPETLVAFGTQMVDDQIPEVRRNVQGQVQENAPVWAEQLSTQVVDSMPSIRKSLEDYVLGQTENVVQQLSGVTETEFRKFLQQDRDTMQDVLNELSASDEISEDTLAALETAMDQALQANTQEQADLVLGTLTELRGKVDKLATGRGLNDEEALERQVLMVARRLQLDEGGGEQFLDSIPAELIAEPEPQLAAATAPQEEAKSDPAPAQDEPAPEPKAEEKSDSEPKKDKKAEPDPEPTEPEKDKDAESE
jgi:hypothetical protein